ncbi:MarR family winged helix-turn-helix transcriptional regulator [Mariniluteicoccus flavus]
MDDLPDRVRRVSHALRRLTVAAAEPHGLNPHQLRALRTVAQLDDPRPSDVAERLRIAPRSATDVLDHLAAAGLVERLPHPDDRRATLLRLTDDGVRVHAAIERDREAGAAAYFSVLSSAERAELARLLALLEGDR